MIEYGTEEPHRVCLECGFERNERTRTKCANCGNATVCTREELARRIEADVAFINFWRGLNTDTLFSYNQARRLYCVAVKAGKV